MASNSLLGRRIAVTRPAAQAVALADAIRERGGEPVLVPLIDIEPVADSLEIRETCARLDDFDLAFFVSPNAVAHGLAAVRARRQWPASLRVATVGEGSRRALEAQGFDSVIAPADAADSEAVLALPEFSAAALAGRKLVIFRGDGGRDLLGNRAHQRGAEVSYLCCYRRRVPQAGGQHLVEAWRDRALDALTLTSSEAARNLAAMVGSPGVGELADAPVFVVHERIAACCEALGFGDVIVAAPGDRGLLAALDAHFQSLG